MICSLNKLPFPDEYSNCVCYQPFEYVKYCPKLKLSQVTGVVGTTLINVVTCEVTATGLEARVAFQN